VPLFSDLEDMLALPSSASIVDDATLNVRTVTVTMARPPMPNMRRSDRSVADHWIRLAGQEAISHAGICTPHGCRCPNCAEYQRVRSRALELFDRGYVPELSEAYRVAMDEITGGAANTLWARPSVPVAPKVPPDLTAMRPEEKRVVVTTPTVKESNWVADRFGGLDV